MLPEASFLETPGSAFPSSVVNSRPLRGIPDPKLRQRRYRYRRPFRRGDRRDAAELTLRRDKLHFNLSGIIKPQNKFAMKNLLLVLTGALLLLMGAVPKTLRRAPAREKSPLT